jgi:hypothetical protein
MEKEARIKKANQQPLYIVKIVSIEKDNTRNFAVMGSTGNVYDVTINTKPKCSCPDYTIRKKRCKHIYFILIKAMKIDDPEKRLKKADLKKLFKNIPKTLEYLLVDEEYRDVYDTISNEENVSTEAKVEMRVEDDICPICLEDLSTGELDYCKNSCGKAIHIGCFKMWVKNNTANCVFCRSEWAKEEIKGTYVNLFDKLGEKEKIK